MKKILFIVIVLGGLWQFYHRTGNVELGPGVYAPDDPVQRESVSSLKHQIEDYGITSLAEFELQAKVLAKKNYFTGREADVSPTDLALGWGRMSDESVLSQIDISQSGRFYRWRVESFPIPRKEIETHSANMHLIPADDYVKDSIDRIMTGDIVKIVGRLVKVESLVDQWRWQSSLTRNDTGAGACELIYVEQLDIVTPN